MFSTAYVPDVLVLLLFDVIWSQFFFVLKLFLPIIQMSNSKIKDNI